MKYLFFIGALILCSITSAQTVTGTVTDDTNIPLPGANVIVLGSSNATSTDFDGNFILENVKEGSTLQFTYVGFQEQTYKVTAEKNQTVNIQLVSAQEQLDEVVIVGASIKKQSIAGAVSSISGKELEETPTPNVVQALQGKIAGVYVQQTGNPAGSASIKIRGSNSFEFGTAPIFVVDGLIMEGNFENINPNDIDDITVLKDAAATAIYGSKGAGGVVVITTKKGSRSGEGKIEYRGWVGTSEFENTIPLMNAQELYELRLDAVANRVLGDDYGPNRQAFINEVNSTGGYTDGSGQFQGVFADYEMETYNSGKSYNWLNEVIRTGIQSNHNLSFSGGGTKGTYYISLNYSDNKGILKNSELKRYNAKVNLVQDVKSWLQIGTNITFSRSEASYQEGSAFGNALGANPLLPIDPELTYLKYADILDQGAYNPIISLDIDDISKRNKLTSSSYLSITPFKNVKVRSTFATDIVSQANFSYYPIYTGQSIRNSRDGQANHWRYEELNYQWDNTITYSKLFNERHDINFLIGQNIRKETNNGTSVGVQRFATDDLTFYNLGGAGDKENFQVGSSFNRNSILSYFAQLTYTLDRKYSVTGTVRRDGSSAFGINNQWGTFPSVTGSWDISKENFLQDSKFINQLRLRAGYGVAGNQNIPRYSYVTLYYGSSSGGSPVFTQGDTAGNPNIKWEEQKQLNIGLDLTVLDNKLTLTANYFNTNNDDLIFRRNVPQSGGFLYRYENIGRLNNQGFELSAVAKIINTSDLTWNISANITRAKNQIKKLSGDATARYSLGGYSGVEIQRTGNLFVGESVNSIYVFQYDGLATAEEAAADPNDFVLGAGDIKVKDRNGDGQIDDDDRYVVGNTDPDFFGGFTTDLNYKGFALNAIFSYSIGRKTTSWIYDSYMGSSGRSAAHTDLLNRWTPENTNTIIPRAYDGGGRYSLAQTDKGIQDASFLRLNTLTLSYTFNSDLMRKIFLKGTRVYVTGSNVFTSTKYKGYDPEGGDSYPITRMLVTGIDISL